MINIYPEPELQSPSHDEIYCGFTLTNTTAIDASVCVRDASEKDNRCFWHSSRNKSISEVINKLDQERQCQKSSGTKTTIRGMLLENINIGDDVDFDDLDCSGCELHEIDFANTEIRNSTFHGGKITNSDFSDTDLRNTSFCQTKLQNIKALDISGQKVRFTSASIESSTFRWSSGKEIKYSGATISDSEFNRSRLRDATFHAANLSNVENSRITYINPDFSKSTLNNTGFDGKVRGGDFELIEIYDSDFSNVDLNDVDPKQSLISESHFNDANLSGLNFESSEFRDTSFSGAEMSDTNLSKCKIYNCQFIKSVLDDSTLINMSSRDSDFTACSIKSSTVSDSEFLSGSFEAVELSDSDISESEFDDVRMVGMQAGPDAYIDQVSFEQLRMCCASFSESIISKSYFQESDLRSADFEGTIIEKVDLRGSDCGLAKFWDADLRDVRIDQNTNLGSSCRYEIEKESKIKNEDIIMLKGSNKRGSNSCGYSCIPGTGLLGGKWSAWNSHSDDELTEFKKSLRVYRAYRYLCDNNQLAQKSRLFHTYEREAERKYHFMNGNLTKWLYLASQKHVMGYGNKYGNIIKSSLFTIIISTILYLFSGGIQSSENSGEIHNITVGWLPNIRLDCMPNVLTDIGSSLYFSVITFSTLGYGDFQPASPLAKFVAGAESLAGVVLTALFVFVLTRRATW